MPEADTPATPRRPYLVLAAVTAVAVVGYAAVAVALIEGRKRPAPPPAWALPPAGPPIFVAPVPVSIQPSPAASPPASPGGPGPRIRPIRESGHRPSGSRRTVTPSPAVTPVVGSTIGLSPVGWPDNRIRHRDLLARMEWITADSPAIDRAESRFLVRAGLAGSGCLSFESAAHPGHFLRHRDFVLRLERGEATDLYRQDATFCPALAGGGFVLRSTNYPDRHLVVADGLLRLLPATPAQATAFRALSPL